MSGESSAEIIRLPRRTLGTIVPKNFGGEEISKFGRVCIALWPEKPAVGLALAAHCSERHALLLIRGQRKPNARVAHIIMGEIIS